MFLFFLILLSSSQSWSSRNAEPCWFVSVTQSETDLEPEHQLNEIKRLPGLKTSGALGTEERDGEGALH